MQLNECAKGEMHLKTHLEVKKKKDFRSFNFIAKTMICTGRESAGVQGMMQNKVKLCNKKQQQKIVK